MNYICIHGHFYQPPRENPWIERIESQESARPFHDWNERITAECYAPNAASRILDSKGLIQSIVNNYASISFNFGPTLLSWLETYSHDVYQSVIAADQQSRSRFGGHGSAVAQAYNHSILPLSNARDKKTQVRWGVRDFELRFGRRPEGMWLPETAVDVATLETLAEEGIAFTILEPHQALRWRPQGESQWRNVKEEGLDPTLPYRCTLPSGRTIAIFFYDGPISRAIAFEGLLHNGDAFVKRLLTGFTDPNVRNHLRHIATDGETYGHHHRYGDMALAYALQELSRNETVQLTNYGEYLERFPPTLEVEIVENTSWSCLHGIERWRAHCGCSSGAHSDWNQKWRTPLRQSLDWLRDSLTSLYEQKVAQWFQDPWAARDDYIAVILNRSAENIDAFFHRHATRELTRPDQVSALQLLELQRHALLMYTSCGWFFDDISGIETVQILEYASRTIELAETLFAKPFETQFVRILEQAQSNRPNEGNGRAIWDQRVKPSRVSLPKLGAHYAVHRLFESSEEPMGMYAHSFRPREHEAYKIGRASIAIGAIEIESTTTRERDSFQYGALHFGDNNLTVGTRRFTDSNDYAHIAKEIKEPFLRDDLAEVIHRMDSLFDHRMTSLRSLFRDDQARVLRRVLDISLSRARDEYRSIYEEHANLLHYVSEEHHPLPRALASAVEFVIHAQLHEALEQEPPQLARAQSLIDDALRLHLMLDVSGLFETVEANLVRALKDWSDEPDNIHALKTALLVAKFSVAPPWNIELWKAQNIFFKTTQNPVARSLVGSLHVEDAWTEAFLSLASVLRIHASAPASPV